MSHLEKAERAEVNSIPQRNYGQPTNANFRKLGNPGPLGLYSFASTTLLLSLMNVQADGVITQNAIVGMAMFVGGLSQLLAGMWEFASANTFGATAFSLYGAFWMSFAMILMPWTGIAAAYTSAVEFEHALGIYLEMWFIITTLLCVGATRRSVGLFSLFFTLALAFLFLGIGKLVSGVAHSTTVAGGTFGIITAFIAFYVGTAQLLIREESWFTLPVGTIPQRLD